MHTISHLSVRNFLSLRDVHVDLNRLNVLVGPNGSGKTNLLKVFQFLGDVARVELVPAIQNVGGFSELFFRGPGAAGGRVMVELTGTLTRHARVTAPDEYRLSFSRRRRQGGYMLQSRHRQPESFYRVEELKFKRTGGRGRRITLVGGKVTVGNTQATGVTLAGDSLKIEGQATGLGTLRRLSDAYGAPEWNNFAEVVEQLRLFEIDVTRARRASAVEAEPRLKPDGSNLAAFLYWINSNDENAYQDICEDVRFVLPSFDGFEFTELGGADSAIRVDIKERKLSGLTPLGRASFGTIRAIGLFAMLHDPSPPTLTCLEEIDHGLHPHALDRIVDRLREASGRTQIILATHSPALVNRLSVEELIIVEREEESGGSRIFRPSADSVDKLEQETGYELGELWFSGLLGGGL